MVALLVVVKSVPEGDTPQDEKGPAEKSESVLPLEPQMVAKSCDVEMGEKVPLSLPGVGSRFYQTMQKAASLAISTAVQKKTLVLESSKSISACRILFSGAILLVLAAALLGLPALLLVARPDTRVDLWPASPATPPGSAYLDIFLAPQPSSAYGAGGAPAVVIAPGGCYGGLWMGSEENPGPPSAARWLNAQGITAFVLHYRLPRRFGAHA
eukprot:RCo045405